MRGKSFPLIALAASVVGLVPALAQGQTAREMAESIHSGDTTATALVDKALSEADRLRDLKGFILLDGDGARRAASASGRPQGPLAGVPIAIKDNINVAGLPTTGGTPTLRAWVAPQDAEIVKRLRAAGAIIIGKTNLHELAFGITSKNAAFGTVRNARASDRVAGGSSGGSAVVVAAGIVPAAIGTDTGGSVRIPSAFNGIVGFRPSTGRYPGDGIIPLANRDTAGPMAASVDDLVLLDGIMSGTSMKLEPVPLKGLRIGVPDAFNDDVDDAVSQVIAAARARLEADGVEFVPVKLPGIAALIEKIGIPAALWEARRKLPAYLERNGIGVTMDALKAGIASPDVKAIFAAIDGPDAVTDEAYRTAVQDLLPQLRAVYAETFVIGRFDAIMFPTSSVLPPLIAASDQTTTLNGREVPLFPTVIRNEDGGANAGLPGLSIPAGVARGDLPVGLELDGPAFSDKRLLAIGLSVEKALNSPISPAAKVAPPR
ncbi:indoleacetamide hydrolase [uncultured Methylobacterium sp.]|jgi:Asp-tRNA(Asn)/Glu-tRNA(Gln) amidotransferase A subunit family amidase|uniref:indoleacetamide hydrolase n=1 Tax=uncultured Methylobacterium sp. TaxID=157278 RepID=UPI00261EA416|nr:indoleacetamide hydrolase [uncultured Methylobacterium sp.]